MSTRKPITIVGGGLAGLTLGIGLRQRTIPVTVWEAGHYPRHRVCGEFISGQGLGTLDRLGLRELLFKNGAIEARTTAFFSARAASAVRELPEPALAISRYVLDDLLARHFQRLGGQLREQERWREADWHEGVVRANGRRLQPVVDGCRWFGLKAHARHVRLSADLEMHLAPSGYVGLCRLTDGEVNICGLFRRSAAAGETPLGWREMMRGAPGSLRHERLAAAEFDPDSFCSVAGLCLEPQRASGSSDCCVGDAITMIAPVTGNGMSMAFESAEMAMGPLAAFSEGKLAWSEAQQIIARHCDAAFARRLGWARWAQRMMLAPRWQNGLVRWAPRWQWLWRLLVERTR